MVNNDTLKTEAKQKRSNMTDLERGQQEYKKMRLGCLLTIALIVIGLILHTCNNDNGSNRNDGSDPSSVIDNPSRQ